MHERCCGRRGFIGLSWVVGPGSRMGKVDPYRTRPPRDWAEGLEARGGPGEVAAGRGVDVKPS